MIVRVCRNQSHRVGARLMRRRKARCRNLKRASRSRSPRERAAVGCRPSGRVAPTARRQCHLELLLLPLRSGRRMLGALAPLAILAWLGTSRLEPPHSAACAIFWKR